MKVKTRKLLRRTITMITIILATIALMLTNKKISEELIIDDISKNVKIIDDSLQIDLPPGINLEYSGKISQDTFFLIYSNHARATEYASCWLGTEENGWTEYEVFLWFEKQYPGNVEIFIIDTNSPVHPLLQKNVSYFKFPHINKEGGNVYNGKKVLKRYP